MSARTPPAIQIARHERMHGRIQQRSTTRIQPCHCATFSHPTAQSTTMSEKKERPKAWSEFRKGSNRFVRSLWAIEWGCEWLSYGLSRWAFLELLEYAGKLTIVLALVSYILG